MAEKTFFDWIATSLLADCGLRAEPWQRLHATRAAGIFHDEPLQQAATILAVLHPHVIDTITQAPVLAVAASAARSDLRQRIGRKALAKDFIARAAPDPRLNAILRAYGVATPLKRLSGELLQARFASRLPTLSGVSELILAQAIPQQPDAQRRWLYWIDNVVARCQRRHPRGAEALTWCLIHLDTPERQDHALDLLDWIEHAGLTFRPNQNYASVKTASDAWHEAQARRFSTPRSRLGRLDMRTADYAPLPKTWSGEADFTAQALFSSADLEDESVRMHHCVRTYWPRVIDGETRIYSIRRSGKRLATLELRPEIGVAGAMTYRQVQLRGPCNAAVSAEVSAAAGAFLIAANAAVAAARARTEAPQTDAAAKTEPRRVGNA